MARVPFTLVACWLSLAVAQPAPTPKFEDYPVTQTFKGKPAMPRFIQQEGTLPDLDDRYRESVEFAAQRGPNFAGRYTVAGWSCGTGCGSMIVIDAETGRLYREMPFGTLDVNAGTTRKNHLFAGLTFRLASRLLIVEGCFDVDYRRSEGKQPRCSRSYYSWDPPRFKLLRSVPLTPPAWLRE